MDDTPKDGETAPKQPLENEAASTTVPPMDNGNADVERKTKEQIEMRANQIANAKIAEAKKALEDEARQKQLQEKEEYKTLYEQSQAKLEEVEKEREAEDKRQALTETRQNVLSDYPDEVKEAAQDLGLTLDEVTDEAVTEFKGKLDKLQTRIGSQRVTPNNPGVPSNKMEYSGEELRTILNDPQKRDAYFRSRGGVTAAMMKPQE